MEGGKNSRGLTEFFLCVYKQTRNIVILWQQQISFTF